jgi:hypothetical protein
MLILDSTCSQLRISSFPVRLHSSCWPCWSHWKWWSVLRCQLHLLSLGRRVAVENRGMILLILMLKLCNLWSWGGGATTKGGFEQCYEFPVESCGRVLADHNFKPFLGARWPVGLMFRFCLRQLNWQQKFDSSPSKYVKNAAKDGKWRFDRKVIWDPMLGYMRKSKTVLDV